MSDSASNSHQTGSDNFPFSDITPAPPGGEIQDTVIADHSGMLTGSETFDAGEFVVHDDVHLRLSSNSPQFDPHGVQLQQFVIDSLIGSGGMGAVYRATDQTLQRTVALKILDRRLASDEALIARFHNEARACARLNHENIARIFFIGEEQGINFIAFEFVDGRNLRELIQERNWLTPAEALNFTLQIAFALRQTSAEGVVHRDIKPSNIIVTNAGRAKLVDLGLARKSDEDSIGDLTVIGATLGTFDFIPPEQARDARLVDVRSDIYSLGCTLYNMLTGQAPYPDGTALQKLLERHIGEPPDPRKINSTVSEELSLIVRRMMAIRPEDRYQTADELIGDLLSVGAHLGLRGINPDSLVWIQPQDKKPGFLQQYSVWIVSVAALLLMVALFDVFPSIVGTKSDAVESDVENDDPPPIGKSTDPPDSKGGDSTEADTNDTSLVEISKTDPTNGGSEPVPSAEIVFPPLTGGDDDTDIEIAEDDDVLRQAQLREANRLNSVASEEPRTGSSLGPSIDEDPEPVDERLISLDSDSKRSFPTLEAAIAEANDGDIVKLRFDGLGGLFAEQRPAWVTDKNITIRAEPGYRPIVQFRIAEDIVESENKIITLVGGSIDLNDVDLHVYIPDAPLASKWTLFSLQGTEQVRLKNVNIRVINPSSRTASVFELTSGPAARLARMRNDGTMPEEDFSVQIDDCWINGNCDLFAVSNTLPGNLQVTNSALSLGNGLLNYTGSSDMERVERGRLDLQLEHVTCLVGDSLIHTRDSDGVAPGPQRKLLPIQVTANNNIFATLTYSSLVFMYGNNDIEEFRQLLTWNGNKNCYDQIDSFWKINSSLSSDDMNDMDFDGWRDFWRDQSTSSEIGAVIGRAVWKNDWKNKTADKIRLSDLMLRETSEVIGGATDGKDIGADFLSLPPDRD